MPDVDGARPLDDLREHVEAIAREDAEAPDGPRPGVRQRERPLERLLSDARDPPGHAQLGRLDDHAEDVVAEAEERRGLLALDARRGPLHEDVRGPDVRLVDQHRGVG